MKKRTSLEQQESMTFDYYQLVEAIVKDLKTIDSIVPREVSRHPLVSSDPTRTVHVGHVMSENARYLIVARKDDFLSYIQTICRDHIEWGERLLHKGWKPGQDFTPRRVETMKRKKQWR